jgi:NAD(P)-dependent dehydrogenase (short-subunit alcohol dehydrogenase family)
MRPRESLAGREIAVAGASGGLGPACVQLLAEEGARVVAGYRSRMPESRAGVAAVQADITGEAGRARLLDSAPGLYGLVVFAGLAARSEALAEESMRVNYFGPIMLAREAAARMEAAATEGAIVLISTMQAAAPFAGSTPYAAPKAALLHAARILAKERRGPSNIRVNVICPGVMQAGMAEPSIAAGKYERYLREGAVNRYGRAHDVARAVRFFLEPDSYITGQALVVDGGLTL